MVAVMNEWLSECEQCSDFHIVRYEDIRADPPGEFRRLLTRVGQSEIDERAFDQAIQFSNFENMRKLEASGEFADKILAPRDVTDEESFKVRRGKVGGFSEYLSLESQRYAAAICARLHPRFGYEFSS